MNEKLIERKLREKVHSLGGHALKFFSPSFTGLPDRIVLMPGGKIKFVEVKTTGKKPTDRQQFVIGMLQKLGFEVWVVDSENSLNDFVKSLAA